MTTATLKRPKAKRSLKSPEVKPTRVRKEKTSHKKRTETKPEDCVCTAKVVCTTCLGKRFKASKKKKPMRKLGSWRGAFKGTPDF